MAEQSKELSREEVEEMMRAFAARSMRWTSLIWLAPVVAIALWMLSGIYIVGPGEQGVVTFFGKYVATTGSGVNYHLPWPFQGANVVDVQNVRRAEIGFRSRRGADQQRVLEEALMLTTDENIVEVGLLVQYRVKDPVQFVFRVENPETLLRAVAEVALRAAVGQMPIDGIITERRADVQQNTRTLMESMLGRYGGGLQITDVFLQVADAPEQVRDAFQDVVRAREDRQRAVNEAQAYREDILPKARGEAQRIINAAEAYREQRLRLARGESERFLSVLKEYREAPAITRERMYIEAMEKVLAKVDKVLVGGEAQQGILPFLPLRGTSGSTTSQPAARPAPTAAPAQAPPQPAQPSPTARPAPTPTATGGRR